MNKQEAADFLEISLRSLERYTSQRRIGHTLKPGKTRPILDYDQSELEQFKVELQAALEPTSANPATPSSTLARLTGKPTQIAKMESRLIPTGDDGEVGGHWIVSVLSELMESRSDLGPKVLLTLPECQKLTGLSRAVLRAAIDAGDLKAQQIGRAWRVKRTDLDEWIKAL